MITRENCTPIRITLAIIQQLKQQAVQDGMPTGLHFKSYYDVEQQNNNTFAGVEDQQDQDNNTFVGVKDIQNLRKQTNIHEQDNNEETILNVNKDIPDINKIQETI